ASRWGPRHCGQSCAQTAAQYTSVQPSDRAIVRVVFVMVALPEVNGVLSDVIETPQPKRNPAREGNLLSQLSLGKQVVGERLKAPSEEPGESRPVSPDIRFAEEVGHVLLPLLPVFRLQQVIADVMLIDFLVERESQIAQVMQPVPVFECLLLRKRQVK